MTPSETPVRTYYVEGMTCGHCTAAVAEEVEKIAGVSRVAVELDDGRLDVEGEGFDDTAVHAAVDEAGYAVRPA